MKVLNLACALGHGFEGWFGSESDFQDQMDRGLLVCPMCGDAHVSKLPSAPRLNLRGVAAAPMAGSCAADASQGASTHTHRPVPTTEADQSFTSAPVLGSTKGDPDAIARGGFSAEMQAVFMKALREVMTNTEDVGDRFPEQARRMHHGEVAPKAIRGEATLAEARELLDEGIDVVPMPLLRSIKNTLQ